MSIFLSEQAADSARKGSADFADYAEGGRAAGPLMLGFVNTSVVSKGIPFGLRMEAFIM